ncbi:MAG: DUF4422 domain-containing protein [Solobacterium sp.]|nr:DUF4422 domain-containing protein [Solobacterium sp.]
MSRDIQILVACHKKSEVPQDPMYLPVHVGAEGKEDIGFVRDDTGDNISGMNSAFSELTGLYWAWKNLDCRYIGLVHYRRYFTLERNRNKIRRDPLGSVLKEKELKPLLYTHKIIVPKKRRYYIETIYSHYDHTFDGKQLDTCREVIAEKCPEYLPDYDDFMARREGYMFNMFIAPKPLADAYCAWLFDILFELKERFGSEGLTDFEKRYPGRVAERLFNVWLLRQLSSGQMKPGDICEIPYFYAGKVNWIKKISSFISAKLFGRKYTKSF